jgi:MacB-like periplasmic core domain
MARPSIINEALIAKFCSHLRISGSIETAIKATGIARESYYGWARKVRQDGGTKLERMFMAAVDQAEGETKLIHEHMLAQHFEKSWRAIAWWLERKYPEEYGLRRPSPLSDLDDPDEQPRPTGVVWQKAPSAAPVKIEPVVADAKPTTVSEEGLPEVVERVSAAWVTGAYYEMLGLEPIAGRLLSTDDDRPDASPVAVITDGYWARRFGRDRQVIGQSLRIEGVPVTIVGVSLPEFTNSPGGQIADITMAVGVMPQVQPGLGARLIDPNYWMLDIVLPAGFCSPRRS